MSFPSEPAALGFGVRWTKVTLAERPTILMSGPVRPRGFHMHHVSFAYPLCASSRHCENSKNWMLCPSCFKTMLWIASFLLFLLSLWEEWHSNSTFLCFTTPGCTQGLSLTLYSGITLLWALGTTCGAGDQTQDSHLQDLCIPIALSLWMLNCVIFI